MRNTMLCEMKEFTLRSLLRKYYICNNVTVTTQFYIGLLFSNLFWFGFLVKQEIPIEEIPMVDLLLQNLALYNTHKYRNHQYHKKWII